NGLRPRPRRCIEDNGLLSPRPPRALGLPMSHQGADAAEEVDGSLPAVRRGQPHHLARCTNGGAEPGDGTVDALEQVGLSDAHCQRVYRGFLELMSLVDHEMLMRWQHCAAPQGIGEQQRMVGHDQVRVLRGAAAVPVEALLRLVVFTMGSETIICGRRGPEPEQLLEAG